jgi:hypothetical protein
MTKYDNQFHFEKKVEQFKNYNNEILDEYLYRIDRRRSKPKPCPFISFLYFFSLFSFILL